VPAQQLAGIPRVSVIIPCHNYARFLPAAVGSVVSQSGVDVDVIVIDDCSSDDTAEVATGLAASDARIEVRSHARNLGHIASYNEGLAAASGEYVVVLSADDILSPGSLARATALLEAYPRIGFAYGRAATFAGLSPPPASGHGGQWTLWGGHNWIRARCRRALNVIRSPEVVMRASVQDAIGGYRLDLPRTGDFEMWMRAALVSDVGRVDGVDQAFYRLHPDSMSHTVHAGKRFQFQARHDAFATLLEASLLPDSEKLYTQARRGLAVMALRDACRSYHRPPVNDASTLELMAFALAMFPGANRLVQWHGLQWRRWLLRRWPAAPRRALEAVSMLENALLWRWLRWTGM
jgi:glycosyltransferase involved in cell wall biosynthesis